MLTNKEKLYQSALTSSKNLRALLKHETRNSETGIFCISFFVKQRNRDFSFQLFGSPVSNARATSGQLVPRLLLLSVPEMRLGTWLARSMDGRLMMKVSDATTYALFTNL